MLTYFRPKGVSEGVQQMPCSCRRSYSVRCRRVDRASAATRGTGLRPHDAFHPGQLQQTQRMAEPACVDVALGRRREEVSCSRETGRRVGSGVVTYLTRLFEVTVNNDSELGLSMSGP